MDIIDREELERIPCDKRFDIGNGHEELCHSTGYEVCMIDANNQKGWWNEYVDRDGELHYGR